MAATVVVLDRPRVGGYVTVHGTHGQDPRGGHVVTLDHLGLVLTLGEKLVLIPWANVTALYFDRVEEAAY